MNARTLRSATMFALCAITASLIAPRLSPAAPDEKVSPGPKELHAGMRHVTEWVDSLSRLDVEEAKQRFAPKKAEESTWDYRGRKELMLTYEFPRYDVELYCLADRVVLVSIDVSPQ